MRPGNSFANTGSDSTVIAPCARPRTIARRLAALLLLLLPLISCSKTSPLQPSTGVYDFSLVDVNPNSATYGQTVSSTSFSGKPLVLFIGAAT